MTIVGLVLLTGAAARDLLSTQADRDSSAILEIEPATVGKAQPSALEMAPPATAVAGTAILTLTITHLEKQKVVFGLRRLPVDGEWSMKFHFPDGGEYRVAAVGQHSRPSRRCEASTVISVTGVEPPARTMFRALVFFVGFDRGGSWCSGVGARCAARCNIGEISTVRAIRLPNRERDLKMLRSD